MSSGVMVRVTRLVQLISSFKNKYFKILTATTVELLVHSVQ
eukprot:SAG31_NODE_1847_length_7095_cov_11.530875_7_plen_41_part_00